MNVQVRPGRAVGRVAVVVAALLTAAFGSTVPTASRGVQSSGNELAADGGSAGDASAESDLDVVGADGSTVAGSSQGRSSSVSGARGATGGAGGQGPSIGGIPARGSGWDEKYVYIGVPTINDLSQFGDAAGYRSVETGNVEADARAVVAGVNARGGLFGREVRIVFHDTKTATIVTDINSAVQAACTAFTQDAHVIAVVTVFSNFDTDAMRSCLAKAGTMLLSSSPAGSADDAVYASTAPNYHTFSTISFNRLAPTLVRRLAAQKYFSGWDNAAGQPSATAPVKLGLVYSAMPIEERVAKLVERVFKDAGHPIAQSVAVGKSPSDMSSAVLTFRSQGITHVIVMLPAADAVLLNFMTQAESQRFRPRYALSTPQLLSFHADNAPHSQLVGSMGVGWDPLLDVLDPRDPGDVGGGQAACRAALAKGGQTFAGDHRFALAIALGLCDGVHMVSEGALAGQGLTVANIRAGLLSIGPKFKAAATFAPTGLNPSSYTLVGSARDVAWGTACECFSYTSPTYAFDAP